MTTKERQQLVAKRKRLAKRRLLASEQRLFERLSQKWYPTVPDHVPHVRLRNGYRIVKKYVPLNPSSIPVEGGLRCICCDGMIEYWNSTPGKMIVGQSSKTTTESTLVNGVPVDVERVLVFDTYKTGRACKGCMLKLKVVLYDQGVE